MLFACQLLPNLPDVLFCQLGRFLLFGFGLPVDKMSQVNFLFDGSDIVVLFAPLHHKHGVGIVVYRSLYVSGLVYDPDELALMVTVGFL